MKKLSIKIIESESNKTIESIICQHLDASAHLTTLSNTIFKRPGQSDKFYKLYVIPAKIDHWHLMDGLITIYYTSGFEMEITRIND